MPMTPTMIRWRIAACWLALAAFAPSKAARANDVPSFPREFRAAWVATVSNIDWPSRPGLDTRTQQAEARAILDRARQLGLNAVIFQVRTAADALYDSPVEPWSASLTGKQGISPGYDPLAFWVEEAHDRGLLLHAWLNPFRARIAGASYAENPKHISQTRPDLVRAYGTSLWLDPGEPDARALTIKVVHDIARRYDVDGIHVDDYFYPYPIADPVHAGSELPFPDDASWARARASGVTGDRSDWRRSNINATIQAMAAAVHITRPRALFGISPFGIVRPGIPPEAQGFDQYTKLAADAGLWFEQGWCDYLSPQLYWPVNSPGQPFRPLLDSWAQRNPKQRHLWPGLSVSRVGDGPKGVEPGEIVRQIQILRESGTATGHVLFSFRALQANKRGIADALVKVEAAPALVPQTPWLGTDPPPAPVAVEVQQLDLSATQCKLVVAIKVPAGSDPPFLWAVQRQTGDRWIGSTHPGEEPSISFTGPTNLATGAMTVASVDRLGNTSSPVVAKFLPTLILRGP